MEGVGDKRALHIGVLFGCFARSLEFTHRFVAFRPFIRTPQNGCCPFRFPFEQLSTIRCLPNEVTTVATWDLGERRSHRGSLFCLTLRVQGGCVYPQRVRLLHTYQILVGQRNIVCTTHTYIPYIYIYTCSIHCIHI